MKIKGYEEISEEEMGKIDIDSRAMFTDYGKDKHYYFKKLKNGKRK